MDIFLDVYQQRKIQEAKDEAEKAQNKARTVEARMADLERRCDRLALACQAMWELLKIDNRFSDSQIEDKILEVDFRDGRLDGKMSRTIVVCKSCGRNSNSTRSNCIYCGAKTPKQNTFE